MRRRAAGTLVLSFLFCYLKLLCHRQILSCLVCPWFFGGRGGQAEEWGVVGRWWFGEGNGLVRTAEGQGGKPGPWKPPLELLVCR